MSDERRIVIVGGGHNGLVAAFYLARAGLRPLVLERRPRVGGAGVTEEFHPGFRCSTLAHVSGSLRPEIARDLRLDRHGLELVQAEPIVSALEPDGRTLALYRDPAKSAQAIAPFSRKDAETYLEFHRLVARMGKVLDRLLGSTPPSVDHPSGADLWGLLRTWRGLRGLGRKEMFELLRWGPMAVADLVEEWFETPLLQAILAARGIFGTFLGPRSAGTSAIFLLRAAIDTHPAGPASLPRGGPGALTQALASAARAAGAEIRTGAEVSRILVQRGSVSGVLLSSGEEIAASTVVSNADPKHTFLRLVDPVHLEPSFVGQIRNYQCQGTLAKVNLALAELPAFKGLDRTELAGRIHIGRDLDYLERAFDDAKYGSYSREPYLDVAIPTIADPALAPVNQHVLSVWAQFAPFHLKNGDWKSEREALAELVVKTLATYAPNLPRLILHRQVITPQDLEETYGLTGGHIFHGELSLDQLFVLRPLLGWSRYRTPLQGLYLCGAGTHPGYGFTGTSGANAAREMLKDLRR